MPFLAEALSGNLRYYYSVLVFLTVSFSGFSLQEGSTTSSPYSTPSPKLLSSDLDSRRMR